MREDRGADLRACGRPALRTRLAARTASGKKSARRSRRSANCSGWTLPPTTTGGPLSPRHGATCWRPATAKLTDKSGNRLLDELRGIADGASADRKVGRRFRRPLGVEWLSEMVANGSSGATRAQTGGACRLSFPQRGWLAGRAAAAVCPFQHHCSAFVATGDWSGRSVVVARPGSASPTATPTTSS
jgi:hypothetical protein